MDTAALLLALAAGAALAAATGLRAFLPLLAVGVAGRLGWVDLQASFAWLGSPPALVAFGSAAVLEILGDKVPVVDHALDAFGILLKPVAATLAMAAMLPGLDPLWATVLALVVGGSVAGSVHVAKAKARLGSSLFTLGAANPVVSLVEDVVATAGVLLAVLWPVVAVLFAALLALGAWMLYRLVRTMARGWPGGPAPAAP